MVNMVWFVGVVKGLLLECMYVLDCWVIYLCGCYVWNLCFVCIIFGYVCIMGMYVIEDVYFLCKEGKLYEVIQ